MKVLLDTHVFLWWIADSPRLTPKAREILANGGNELLFSAASSWEIAIKVALGKVSLPSPPARFIPHQLALQGILALPIEHAHAWRVAELPRHHRDPFDRLLLAQAQIEKVPILTGDPMFSRYEVKTFW